MTGIDLALGFAAGMLSTLSPCVLPLLPVVLGAALAQHRLGPLALSAGLALSFGGAALLIASVGLAAGFDAAVIRAVGAAMLVAMGLVLAIPRLQGLLAAALGPLAGRAGGWLAGVRGDGLGGQFAVGLLLGAVWSPCVGPTLGATLGLAANAASAPLAALVLVAFGLGAAAPMLAIAYGSRGLLARRGGAAAWTGRAKPALGIALAGIGALVLTGADKALEAVLVAAMPEWLVALTTRF